MLDKYSTTESHSLVQLTIFKRAHSFIFRVKHEKGYAICGLAWHPTYGRICYTDVEGNLGILENVCDLSEKVSSHKVMCSVLEDVFPLFLQLCGFREHKPPHFLVKLQFVFLS